jgi:cell division protein FtsB
MTPLGQFRKYATPALTVLVLLYSAMLLADTVPAFVANRERVQRLDREVADLEKAVQRKDQYRKDLESDPATIEHEIRRVLKLNKSGEHTYVYTPDSLVQP